MRSILLTIRQQRDAKRSGHTPKLIVPKFQAEGWDSAPHSVVEQHAFADSRIIVRGNETKRCKSKRAQLSTNSNRCYMQRN
jgi:hypothetical protein